MSDKPSLYVVEKKEVVILVVLFILVTILAFTMGVRYGETLGKKSAYQMVAEEAKHAPVEAEKIGGTLGSETPKEADSHGEAPVGEHDLDPGHAAVDPHAAKDAHAPKDPHAPKDAHAAAEHSPEAAAKTAEKGAVKAPVANSAAVDAVEKESDEYLLNALKDAGVESPGGKTPKNAKLPEEVKKIKSGSWLIQVGSHPTRKEAEGQLKLLQAKKVSAQILAPFKDAHGEWHRVVIGEFKNKKEAEHEATSLKGHGAILSYFVWRLP